MQVVVTGEEMKKIDNYTIQSIGIPSMVLMERAAWSMVQKMLPYLEEKTQVLAVCGSGNNGGDGVAVARILHGMGYSAAIYMMGSTDKWTEETKSQIQIARNIGVPEYNELDLTSVQVVVDGLFGIGLDRMIKEPYESLINYLNQWRDAKEEHKIWSVDIPSGISAKNGQVLGTAVCADYTVTFGYMKCGLVLYPGRSKAGVCYVEDIGFPKKALYDHFPKGFSMDQSDMDKLPKRSMDSNKGDYGKILVIAGSKNMSGAAYFAAYAAYVMGAGLVRILTVEANRQILQTALPQAMISVWEELNDEELEKTLKWASSVIIGPGIGTDSCMENRLDKILYKIKCPIVLDADGLNLLARNKMWYDKMKARLVVTPHMGEMSRLTGCSIDELKSDRAAWAAHFAKEHEVVCVLKDSSSVISDGERICYQRTGNDGMSTGGSGDILAGMIGSLVGMGCDLFIASCLSAYIHGCAGDHARELYGARAMTSVEIIDGLKAVLKKIENRG